MHPTSFRTLLPVLLGLCLPCVPFTAGPRLRAAPQEAPAMDADRLAIALEALNRMKGMDLEANPAVKQAVLKLLGQVRGKPQFLDLVRDFNLKDQDPELLELVLRYPETSTGVESLRLLLEHHAEPLFKKVLEESNIARTLALIRIANSSASTAMVPLILPILTDPLRTLDVKQEVVRTLAKTEIGAASLMTMAIEKKLPDALRALAAQELSFIRWPKLREEAADIFKQAGAAVSTPQTTSNGETLPPVSELAKRSGNAAHGAQVFRSENVGCIKCHPVNGEGTEFGPALSEVGTKLGKDALYVAILEPSAGISFGYEAWSIELKDGDEAFGLIASETADELAIKTQTGIVTRYRKSDIARRTMQKSSIMPSGLQQAMTTQDLIDLVEYLTTLKKAK